MEEQRPQKEAPAQATPEKTQAQGSNKFLLIGIFAVVLVLNAIIALFLIKTTKPESAEDKAAKMQADSALHANETATSMGATSEEPIGAIVNIAGTNGERFLKAEVIVEYDNLAYPKLGEELKKRIPKFKDLLINHLSRQTLEDLTEPDAKDKIRKELLRMMNATIPPEEGEVREVLFTTYIIQ